MGWPKTRASFARIAGVSAAAITKAAREGGALSEAVLPNKQIDLDHPAARQYLKEKGRRVPTRGVNDPPREPPVVPVPAEGAAWPPPDGPGSNEDLLSLSEYLHPIIARFGGGGDGSDAEEFTEWIDALKKIEETIERRLKNAKARGDVVDRELVRTHVFGAIDRLHRQLLRDASATIVQRLYSMAKAGDSIEDAQKVVRQIISSHLKPSQAAASRILSG